VSRLGAAGGLRGRIALAVRLAPLAVLCLDACRDPSFRDASRAAAPLGSPAASAPEAVASPRGGTFRGIERCAPVWWQPLRDLVDPRTCEPKQGPATLAAAGGVFLLGSTTDVSEQRTPIPKPTRCGPKGHGSNGKFVAEVRGARSPDSPPIAFVHLHRFDLVPISFAALPGFQASFLVRAKTPWSRLLDFFARDESPLCRGGRCSWSDFHYGDPDQHRGPRLRDLIDASGGPGAHERVVYYLTRSKPGKRVHWPDAALGDLRNPAYRAWRVEEARRALEVGGYDAVMLNEKFAQYRERSGHWLGGAARDVEELNRVPRTLWSAAPDGYGYSEYASGWAALGRDLRAAGVPYAVRMSASAWWGKGLDDRATQAVDEGALVRETVQGASLFLVSKWGTPEERAALEGIDRELHARGAGLVLISQARAICP
jgi:hypothetical protein